MLLRMVFLNRSRSFVNFPSILCSSLRPSPISRRINPRERRCLDSRHQGYRWCLHLLLKHIVRDRSIGDSPVFRTDKVPVDDGNFLNTFEGVLRMFFSDIAGCKLFPVELARCTSLRRHNRRNTSVMVQASAGTQFAKETQEQLTRSEYTNHKINSSCELHAILRPAKMNACCLLKL